MSKKKIKSIEELQTELKKVYERVSPETITEFTENEPVNHEVRGCADCPFKVESSISSRIVTDGNIFYHVHCQFDAEKQSIEKYVVKENCTPKDCPLQKGSINVVLV